MVTMDNVIIINGMRFIDVTNQTVGGTTYNYEEAVALSNGRCIATSYHYVNVPRKKKSRSKIKTKWNDNLSMKNNKSI